MRFTIFVISVFTLVVCSCKKNENGTVTLPFKIISVSPDTGSIGTTVTIVGTNLNGLDSVKLNGKLCSIKTNNGDTVSITLPKAAGSGPITIIFDDSTITWPGFHFRFTNYVTTVAGNGKDAKTNGVGTNASFSFPYEILFNSKGNLIVGMYSYNPSLKMVDQAANVTTFAGNPVMGLVDGGPGIAEFGNSVGAMALGKNDTVYVVDHDYNRIRKVAPDGHVITYAGNGQGGQDNGPVASASFLSIAAMAFDAVGNLFFSDGYYIRKISTDGIVSFFVGNGTAGSKDGTGTAASLAGPGPLWFDKKGILYVIDAYKIRRITPDGVITTDAGSAQQHALDSLAAQAGSWGFNTMIADDEGNLYFSDETKIRMVSTDGQVSTLAGTEVYGFADGPALTAMFEDPYGLAFDKDHNLWIADPHNQRIRKLIIQ